MKRRSASTASSMHRSPRASASCRSVRATIRAGSPCCRWAGQARCMPAPWPKSWGSGASSCRVCRGVLSAIGLLSAPIEHEVSTALPRPVDGLDLAEVRATLAKLDARCSALMAKESVVSKDVVRRYCADICYAGQAYHLEVPFEPTASDPLSALKTAFFAAHDRTYGYAPKAPIRLVN